MKKIKLNNDAIIYCYGKPNKFFIGGLHGEERASVIALNTILRDNLKDVWILPCLNRQGFEEMNRFCGIKNLNKEFKDDTKLIFIKELMEILKNEKPQFVVDMHEDVDSFCDYIWTSFDNNFNEEVQSFCKKEDIGLLYHPEVVEYKYSCENWIRANICTAFTTETRQYSPLTRRIQMNKKFIDFFINL